LSSEAPAQAADKYTIKDIGAVAVGSTVESINDSGPLAGATPISQTRNTAWWFDGKKSSISAIAVESAAERWTSMPRARSWEISAGMPLSIMTENS
jgi:hypothetical protein